jgi:PAS domain S-box-containing protein
MAPTRASPVPSGNAGAASDRTAEVMHRAALAVSRVGGSDVVEELVRELTTILGVDAAFAAVFSDEKRTHMRTLASRLDGKMLRRFDYPLAGSPCAEVVGRDFHYVGHGAAAAFPPGTIFGAKGMDCYAAYPLTDSAGDPLGLVVAMNREPLDEPGLAESTLKIFAVRIAAEVERARTEAALRSAALAVSSAKGEAVFPELVRYLATILKADIAFIALPDVDDSCRLRMLAFYMDGTIRENFSYDARGTPCETVIGQQFRIYPSELCLLFPGDRDFEALGAESYAGFPLRDGHGTALGLISVVARRPMVRADRVESILQIFAVRAAAEIERTRAERALRESETSYRAIFEAAEDAIFVHDWDTGAIVDVNPKACETYGYAPAEMRRMRVGDVSSNVPPYTDGEALRHIGEAKLGRTVQFEWHRRNRDGSLHWDEVRLKSAVIGGHRRVLAFSREITERKLAVEALRASEEQYRTIFNASSDALILWDSKLRRVDVNPAYERMYGWTREESIGNAYENRSVSRQYSEPRLALVRRALAGEMCYAELDAVRKNGERFRAEIHTIPMNYRGQPHVLAIARDITERRRAEEERSMLEAQLRQAQKMEAIGHLTGGVAHDFNNILTSVMGYLALGTERAAQLGDAKLGGYLSQVERAARRARDLIAQMLAFSRGQRSERAPASLAALAADSLNLLRSTLPATIELETVCEPEAPRAMIDGVQIEQVLLNLCLNARDAIGGTGKIRVAVREVRDVEATCASCRGDVSGRFVELSVNDSGPGIPSGVVDRMFEPFFSTKDVGRGSGMGLAMVHGIVHQHGGHVVVDVRPGEGTTFRVLLPGVAAAPATNAGVQGGAGALSNRPQLTGRVLVVDDEQMVGEFMGELLSGWGLDVTVERQPLAAQTWFARDPSRIDVVVTDQTMPKMTGLELARRMRQVRADLPVILYTGYADEITAADLAAAGVAALLRKPVEPGALFQQLERHLPPERVTSDPRLTPAA